MDRAGFASFDTPIGRCGIAWRHDRVVRIWLPGRLPGGVRTAPPPAIRRAIAAMSALLRGEPADLRDIDLDMTAVPEPTRRIYDAARTIPAGATATYGELARRLGAPHAARAVGQAMSRNPFPIVVPCHRVVAAGGKLGGFSAPGGAATKRRMLMIERAPHLGAVGASVLAIVVALVGCNEASVDEPAASVIEAETIVAACVAEATCPSTENCFDVVEGSELGTCFKLCDNNGQGCSNGEQCTLQKQFCCRSVWCIQTLHPDPDAKHYYVTNIEPGCNTGKECVACPPGKVRDQSDPGNPACCTPSWSCGARQCGTVGDSCGWPHSCGTCPGDQTCTANGCCRKTRAEACGDRHCGTVSDGCGGTYGCGSGCPGGQTCGAGGYCACSPPKQNCGLEPPARPTCATTCP